MAGKTVLILGGGVGGQVAASELRRRLGPEHRVIVVDRSLQHVFSPSLLWVVAGWRRPQQITKDLRRMVSSGVEVVQGQVRSIDPGKQEVRVESQVLHYDYLIVALGAELAPETIPGYAEAAQGFYDLDGATRLSETLGSFTGGRLAVVVSSLPYKCPAAPYEAALLLRDVFRRRGMLGEIDLQVFTPEGLPMPVAGPAVGQALKGMLEERGIGFHPNVQLESVSPEKGELQFRDGSTAGYDLLVAIPPHRAPDAVQQSALSNEAGWVPVDRRTLRTRYENVYAVGDATSISLPNGRPLPKAGVFAHAEAEAVARTVVAAVSGVGSSAEFDGRGYCWVEIGGGAAGFASGAFYNEPEPLVELRRPGRMWHWGKVLFESYWLGGGLIQASSRWALRAGSRLLRVPASL